MDAFQQLGTVPLWLLELTYLTRFTQLPTGHPPSIELLDLQRFSGWASCGCVLYLHARITKSILRLTLDWARDCSGSSLVFRRRPVQRRTLRYVNSFAVTDYNLTAGES